MSCNCTISYIRFWFKFHFLTKFTKPVDFHGPWRPIFLSSSLTQQGGKCICSHGLTRLFHFSVTTPGTEASETQKVTAVPGSPSKTPEELSTPPEEERLCLQTPTLSEQGDSPIVQEPEEPLVPSGESSPRKTSLLIVESADGQLRTLAGLDEDTAFQKVRIYFSMSFPTYNKATNLPVSISLMA